MRQKTQKTRQKAAVFHLRLHGSMRPWARHPTCHICISPAAELFQLRVRRLKWCRVLHALVQPTSLLKTSSHSPFASESRLPSFQAALVIEAFPVPASPSISAPVQFAMSFDVPPVPLPLLYRVEEKRKQLGMTQAEMARILGINQPHYANALRGAEF
jgi:hypothetical protein